VEKSKKNEKINNKGKGKNEMQLICSIRILYKRFIKGRRNCKY
jgi:hypothetical protein